MTNKPKQVVVVIGAGASKFCSNGLLPFDQGWQPPLANELFMFREARRNIWPLIEPYPGAQSIAALIQTAMRKRGDASWNIEAELSALATHDHPAVRETFKQVPAYLRDYLQTVCNKYMGAAGSYIVLLKTLVADTNHNVTFVSLNYDTLLERAIERFDATACFREEEDFISHPQIKVIKPHGSVDWFTALPTAAPRSAEEWVQAAQSIDLAAIRTGGMKVERDPRFTFNLDFNDRAWFPVLTAPLAEKGPHSMVCPPDHVQALRGAVSHAEKLLFIGTSGNDTDLLSVMEDAAGKPERICVVGKDRADAVNIANRMKKTAPTLFRSADLWPFDSGFDEFVNEERQRDLEKFAR